MNDLSLLLLHNFYQQPGGEDQVYRAEGKLLEENGHKVVHFTRRNDELLHMNSLRQAQVTLWNGTVYRELHRLLVQERLQLAHFHNTFPLISPAAYYAVRDQGVPVVQTLHNYRLMCPAGIFFRDGHICEECMGRNLAWPGVVHACYRGSRTATATVSSMLGIHHLVGTWRSTVSLFIAMTKFGRQKFIDAGLPAERVVVKPHFVPDPGVGSGDGGYALFVGRLTAEKGVMTLLKAWRMLGGRLPLKVAGTGPLSPIVAEEVTRLPGAEWLGQVPPETVSGLMARATCLIVPSEWYETFGRVAIEAFAVGTPVLVSDVGAVAELVEDGGTGFRFVPGDPSSLAARVDELLSHPAAIAAMRLQARHTYETNYTPEVNYRMMMDIYARAREMRLR